MKIEKTIRLNDGQGIHVMGEIYPFTLNKYLKECNYSYEWNQHQQTHFAMRRYIRYHCAELSEWLEKNNCETTNWVHPNIFEALSHSNVINFIWGIGFRINDPKESVFVLRWS
jgi:hypothetical protein